MSARLKQRASEKAMGEIVTFYSYKGGTGRTMSLVNLASLLADKIGYDERILLIDWDLEAPGLHRYFHSNLKTTGQESQSISGFPGLIDLFGQLKSAGEQSAIRRKRNQEIRASALLDTINIDEYIFSTHVKNLDIITAGRFDAGYGVRVNSFPWEGFYEQYPLVFRELAERLKKKYRYVFIDSRTGQTDTAGICTTLMPEKLVLVFTPNRQSLYGIETVLKDAVAYRRRDGDSRPLVAYPLPSRVDVSLDDLRARWRFGDQQQRVEGYEPFLTRTLREAYGLRYCHLKRYFDEVQIKHSAHYSFGEEIAVLNERSQRVEDEYSLTRAYQNLLNWLEQGFLPWESPEAIHLMRSIENRVRVVPLEQRALIEDLNALRGLLTRLNDAGDIGNAELATRIGERLARKYLGEAHNESLAYANITNSLLLRSGKLTDTLSLLEKTLDLCSQHLGEDHPETLTAQNNLAKKRSAQGDLLGALELNRSVLAARRRVLGEEHPDTLRTMGNLATTLSANGDLLGALELNRSVLAACRRVLGEEHPDTLRAMGNLACTLHDQGDLLGALELNRSVLAARRRVLGEEHPDTLRTICNLASTLFAQGDLAGAQELNRSVLVVCRRVLGEEHPDTLRAMGDFASMLSAQGDLAGALELNRSVLAARRRVLGEEHPDTLRAMGDLANALYAQGDLAGALELSQLALTARRRVLGEEHPDTLRAMGNLASTLSAQGDLAGALELNRSVLAAYRRVLGEEHPDTLRTMSNLASMLSAQGDLVGALELSRSVLAAYRRVLGEEHPDTLREMGNLASTLYSQGDLAGTLELNQSVLAARRRVLGEEHPDTLRAMGNLAGILYDQGDLLGALELNRSVLAARRRVLGEEHPETLTAMGNLANMLSAQGDVAGALELNQLVLAARRRVLGEEHPDTLRAMGNLASTLLSQGDLEGALEMNRSVLAARRHVLGEEHPDTLRTMLNLARGLEVLGQAQAAKELLNQVSAIRRRKVERDDARQVGTPVRIVGVGGAGCNAIQSLQRLAVQDVGLLAINTDLGSLESLARIEVPVRILLGDGVGAGGKPDIAELAALQRRAAIRKSLEGTRLLLIVAGLGGGTGSGASPVVADVAREMGIVTVGVVTAPFGFEGARRMSLAKKAEEKLLRKLDALIVVPNDDLMEKLGEEATMEAAFSSAGDEIASITQGVIEVATRPGLVNIDLEDLCAVLMRKGRAAATMAISEGGERALNAINAAIDAINGKQDFRLSSAESVLLNITASRSLSMKELKQVMGATSLHVSPVATLILGAVFDDSLGDKLRVTLIAAGKVGTSATTQLQTQSR